MRVVYVLPINWGGIPHYTAELANAVAKYADVIVLKPKGSNDHLFSTDLQVINAFEPLNLEKGREKEAFSINNVRGLLSYNQLKQIHSLEPDIIHFPGTYVHASFFSKLHKLDQKYPIIQTRHSVADAYITSSKNKGFFRTLLWNLNDKEKHMINPHRYIVHTNENRDALIRSGVQPESICVVPHGAYTFFKNFSESYANEEQGADVVLYFGFIDRHKGVEYFIESAALVADILPEAKFIIAGQGNLSEILTTSLSENSLFEVHNKYIPDSMVSKLFQRAKVVVLPYVYHQGLSGVLAIAFAFGKPVIVTDVGNLSEFAGGCGITVPPKDSKSLANAIIRILTNEPLSRVYSNNSYKMGLELSWDNIATLHMNIYSTVYNEFHRLND